MKKMCSACRMNPCHPSCPNAEPQNCVCDICGSTLSKYIYLNDEYICSSCLEDHTALQLAERLGIIEED